MSYNKFINATDSMPEPITSTQLLDFLVKAHKVSSHLNVFKVNGGYKISVLADWCSDDHFDNQSTFITNDGTYEYNSDYSCFFSMDGQLYDLVKEQEEREERRRKRRELLSRLTDEEIELLGVE